MDTTEAAEVDVEDIRALLVARAGIPNVPPASSASPAGAAGSGV
jgi:hypothetical protein